MPYIQGFHISSSKLPISFSSPPIIPSVLFLPLPCLVGGFIFKVGYNEADFYLPHLWTLRSDCHRRWAATDDHAKPLCGISSSLKSGSMMLPSCHHHPNLRRTQGEQPFCYFLSLESRKFMPDHACDLRRSKYGFYCFTVLL